MGKLLSLVDRPKLVAHPHLDMAAGKGGSCDAHSCVGNRWNLSGMPRHGASPPDMTPHGASHRTARSSQIVHVGWIRSQEFATSIMNSGVCAILDKGGRDALHHQCPRYSTSVIPLLLQGPCGLFGSGASDFRVTTVGSLKAKTLELGP